jgi:phenylpropionate dioxygenase-like ring-hydroxylating dioxygenase large terminal subunit
MTAEVLTPASREAPTNLQVTWEPELRRYWYAVARADAVRGPIHRRLLGTDLVLWSPVAGEYAAAEDRCPHRDARLSDGWLDDCSLVCPYHGWEFDGGGQATRIPQLPADAAIPPRAELTTYPVVERYGWLWTCLSDDPVAPVPALAELDDPKWRVIHEPESEWDCSAASLVDNNNDAAHIAFVHRGTFGSPARPDVPVADVTRTGFGITVRIEIPVTSRPGTVEETKRYVYNDVHAPFLMVIRIAYSDGVNHIMLKSCTPADDNSTRQLQVVFRDDSEADVPAAEIAAFDARVWEEDKSVLERALPRYSLDLTTNVHLKIDRPSIEYRRLLADVISGRFPE